MKALITGASSGIGLEIAKCLAKKKYELILVARNKEKLEELTQNKDIFNSQSIDENKKLTNMQKLKEELKHQIENISNEIEKLQTIGYERKKQIEKIK